MFEPGQPWYAMTPAEIHAAGYGLLEGLKPWKRCVVPYSDIEKLDLSSEWKADIREKYHYYRTAFEIPETAVIIAAGVWLMITRGPEVMALLSKTVYGV